MVDTKLQKTPAELEQEFYSKPYNISYSGLNKLVYSPTLFYNHYILQQREDKTDSYLVDGKVIHCLLLDDGSFDTNFVLLPTSLPTGNSRLVIDKVFAQANDNSGKLSDHTQVILDILKEINLHQSLKTDEQRVAKIVTEENDSYFAFLDTKGNRDIIDSETLQRCSQSVDLLKKNNKVCDLLGLFTSGLENFQMFNEISLSVGSDVTNRPFGLKGVADSIQVNHDKKIIFINDLKTTSKTITDFPETINVYNYNLQAAIYYWLVSEKFKDVITEDWELIFNFIVIDRYDQVYCFEVSKETILKWHDELLDKLDEASWHYNNRNYKLPYRFEISPVIL